MRKIILMYSVWRIRHLRVLLLLGPDLWLVDGRIYAAVSNIVEE
jgi:hypothetical protein